LRSPVTFLYDRPPVGGAQLSRIVGGCPSAAPAFRFGRVARDTSGRDISEQRSRATRWRWTGPSRR